MTRSKRERDHLGRIKAMPCLLCQHLDQPQTAATEAHHVRTGQGGAQRAGDYLTVPLCGDCHRGPLGIHGDQTLLRIAKLGEMDLLNDTIRRLLA